MSGKIVEKPELETDVAAESDAPHPLDSWLKRELQALYGESERETLPPDLAELAERLEAQLRGPGRTSGGNGSPDRSPGDDRGAAKTHKGPGPGSKR